MKKLFIVATVLLTSACGNSESNDTVADNHRLNDLRIRGLLGSVKKETRHTYWPKLEGGKWGPDGQHFFKSVTHYNRDGFLTSSDRCNYNDGKETDCTKTITEFKDGLPALEKHYAGDSLTNISSITFINDSTYKSLRQYDPIMESTTELRNNRLVTTSTYTDKKTGAIGTYVYTTKYNKKGIAIERSSSTRITIGGKPVEGLDMDREDTTTSEVISYDKKGNITKELMTTRGQDTTYSEFRVIEYEYYE